MDPSVLQSLMAQQNPVTQQDIMPQAPRSPWAGMSQQMQDLLWKALNKERDRQMKDMKQAPHIAEVDSQIKKMGGW